MLPQPLCSSYDQTAHPPPTRSTSTWYRCRCTNCGHKPANAILKAITETKRKADLLAHFQQDDFALLLPQTSAEGVRAFAGRVMQALKPGFGTAQQKDLPELGLLPGEKLVLTMGIGSLPEECQDWVKLLAFLNQNQRRFE